MTMFRIPLRSILGWTSVIALVSFPLAPVASALEMFMKIGDIKGESKDKAHKDEIDVLAWSWGMSNSGYGGSGGGGSRASKPNVQNFSFTKYLDTSSPALMLSTLTGNSHKEAVFKVNTSGKDSTEFLVITFKDVFVTSHSSGGSAGEDRLTENVTLDFESFELSYKPIDNKGKPVKPEIIKFDISKIQVD